jgi:hypothetical protein
MPALGWRIRRGIAPIKEAAAASNFRENAQNCVRRSPVCHKSSASVSGFEPPGRKGPLIMNKNFRLPLLGAASVLAAMSFAAAPAANAADNLPPLTTNQHYLEEISKKHNLDAKDAMAVFGYVLKTLPDKVKVYPTENYYYFSFICNGINYEGNIRLDASDRDQGFVSFAYVEQPAQWRHTADDNYHHLGANEGVKVEKLAPLSYKITYKDRSVVFDLNDLSKVKPPEGMLNPNEVYIGPSFDESGIAFYLVFNKDLKIFHFIYDPKDSFPERFDSVTFSDKITVGRRTSFAMYKDQKKDRQILIGVHQSNTFVNNYFDGPFDQLPDNFIQGDTLKDAVESIVPEFKGKLDRFGAKPGGEERYAITPYMYYDGLDDLKMVEDCVNDKALPADQYYSCFNAPPADDGADEGADQNAAGTPDGANPAPAPAAPDGAKKPKP